MRKLVTMLAFLLFTAGWSESLTLEEYLQLRKEGSPTSQQIINSYIGGMGEGLTWANTGCETACNKKLYCPPKSVALQPQNYVEIFNKKLEKDTSSIKVEQNRPMLVVILLKGLEETFPCDNKK